MMYSEVGFTFLPHRVTLKSLNEPTLQSGMEPLQYHPWPTVPLPGPRIHLLSGLYGYNLSMSSTRFSTMLSLDQPLPTKLASDLSLDKSLPDPILHFLDHPFQTWQSAVLFVIILGCLILVSAFMGKRYTEALRLNSWGSRNNPPTLESLHHSHSTVGRSQDENTASAVTGFDPFLDTDIKSRPGILLTPPRISIGEVHNSKIAQRRRTSSARSDRNNGAIASDYSPQK